MSNKAPSKEVNSSPDTPILYRQSDGSLSKEAHDKDYMELTLNSGKHSDLVKKILRQRIEKRANEFPRWPASCSSGVRTLWIESRFWYDRERLLPDFDDDWRKYRSKYLHSLELDPREPVHVPEYERMMINPIKRFMQIPGDWLESGLKRVTNADKMHTSLYRSIITKHFKIYLAIIAGYYYLRWHHSHWEDRKGWTIITSAPVIYQNHPKYPFEDYRTEPHHHYEEHFTQRTIFRDLRDYEDSGEVL